jgi:hypothetical protein
MKQISHKEAQRRAMESGMYTQQLSSAMWMWMDKHGLDVAKIELGIAGKTLYGTWPKGWKHQMLAECKRDAIDAATSWWIAANCRKLPGIGGDVLWLFPENAQAHTPAPLTNPKP